jgi:DnaK suppressor protein
MAYKRNGVGAWNIMERFRQLSKPEIAKYKALLEGKYAELTSFLPRRENITIERRPDAVDEAVLAADREIQVRALDSSATLLGNVIAALGRIESGAYGTCDGCGQQIGRKRLDAVPWTPLCIECQQELERQALDRGIFSEAA